jgi:hypothetical protein
LRQRVGLTFEADVQIAGYCDVPIEKKPQARSTRCERYGPGIGIHNQANAELESQ